MAANNEKGLQKTSAARKAEANEEAYQAYGDEVSRKPDAADDGILETETRGGVAQLVRAKDS